MTNISRRGVLTPLGIELAEAYETRSLSEVAKEYGVAKRSITEAFKTHYGMTKDEWWQQHKSRIYRPGRPFTYWDRDTKELTAEGAELSAYMNPLLPRNPRGLRRQRFHLTATFRTRPRRADQTRLAKNTESPEDLILRAFSLPAAGTVSGASGRPT